MENDNKRVLVIANDFTTIMHFRLELLERLQKDGYKTILALPNNDKNVEFDKVVTKRIDIPMSRFGTNPINEYKTYKALRKVIRSEKPDIVLTYTAKPNIYGGLAASAEKVPYIATVTGLGSNFDKENLVSKVMIQLQKAAFMKAKKVFFQNEQNMETLHNHGIALNNYGMVPGPGVNLSTNSFEPMPNNAKTIFLSAARVRKDKGYDELFAVIRRFHDDRIPAEFHVIGWYEDDNYKPIVEEMQEKYGVHFHDFVPHEQMHNYITMCDCLVHPSHHEGMSNVILEAAATGRPCIASDICGCREPIKDGETGFLFKASDADDLYQKMIEFVNCPGDQRAEMGKRARELMELSFDRNLVISTYINEINRED